MAACKKTEMESYERKKKYFLLHKWDIIRIKKHEMMDEKYKEIQKIERSTLLAKHVLVSGIIREIHQKFRDHRNLKILMKKRFFYSMKI